MGGQSSARALACIMGDMDMLRPLSLAGVRCVVVTRPGWPALYSRFTRASLVWDDFWSDGEGLVEALIRLGTAQSEPPVLFYEQDAQLLLVSRHRDRLAQAFRFVVPDPVLVEDLVDKSRFHTLAQRLHLPVPATRRVRPAVDAVPSDLGMPFPVVVKPLVRRASWNTIGGWQKAVQIDTPEELRRLWPGLAATELEFLVQERIAGPESSIESYHAYVDSTGCIVGEFTGRKIRTLPASYGHSTALTITRAADVAELGRGLIRTLNLQGVAKFDFKRAPNGGLRLLEINPRFNLWHHLGAVAGVNLPALVYGDMLGLPRPPVRTARAGTCWCTLSNDWQAAKASGIRLTTWLLWALQCEAKSRVSWDDPMPVLRTKLPRVAGTMVSRARKLRRARRGGAGVA